MKIEHIAFNVQDPVKVAQWYKDHLEMKIVMKMEQAPFTHFLADEAGNMMEIYNNPDAPVPNYAEMHPLVLHLAFVSKDPDADKVRLMEAGATYVEEVTPPDGSKLIMMRDPWGLAIQFCMRTNPFV